MKLPDQIILSKLDHPKSHWLAKAYAGNKPIYEYGDDPNQAIENLTVAFQDIKCPYCIDTGYYYDEIKRKTLVCRHEQY